MKRPQVKDYFGKDAKLNDVAKAQEESPMLFSYAQGLERYIYYLEEKLSEVKSDTDTE